MPGIGSHPRLIHDSQHAPSLARRDRQITQTRRSRPAVVVLGTGFGWILATLAVAGYTGLGRNNDGP